MPSLFLHRTGVVCVNLSCLSCNVPDTAGWCLHQHQVTGPVSSLSWSHFPRGWNLSYLKLFKSFAPTSCHLWHACTETLPRELPVSGLRSLYVFLKYLKKKSLHSLVQDVSATPSCVMCWIQTCWLGLPQLPLTASQLPCFYGSRLNSLWTLFMPTRLRSYFVVRPPCPVKSYFFKKLFFINFAIAVVPVLPSLLPSPSTTITATRDIELKACRGVGILWGALHPWSHDSSWSSHGVDTCYTHFMVEDIEAERDHITQSHTTNTPVSGRTRI